MTWEYHVLLVTYNFPRTDTVGLTQQLNALVAEEWELVSASPYVPPRGADYIVFTFKRGKPA